MKLSLKSRIKKLKYVFVFVFLNFTVFFLLIFAIFFYLNFTLLDLVILTAIILILTVDYLIWKFLYDILIYPRDFFDKVPSCDDDDEIFEFLMWNMGLSYLSIFFWLSEPFFIHSLYKFILRNT